MAFSRFTQDMNIISKLDNEPNDVGGLSASALKARFDAAGIAMKAALNKLVSELGAAAAAGNIGFTPTAGVNRTNVQDAIASVQAQLAGVSQGAVADGSITAEKLAAGAVTAEKLAPSLMKTENIRSDTSALCTEDGKQDAPLHWHLEELAQCVCMRASYDTNQNTITVTAVNTAAYTRYIRPGMFFILLPEYNFSIPSTARNCQIHFADAYGDVRGYLSLEQSAYFQSGRGYLIADTGALEYILVNLAEA